MKLKLKTLLMAGVIAVSVAAFAGCSTGSGDNSTSNGDSVSSGGNNSVSTVNDYGELCIEDLTVYINSNRGTTFAEISPVFTKPEKAEALQYTYDTEYLKIEDNIVTPLMRETKTLNVRAKSEHFNTVFKVNVEYIRFTGVGASSLYDVSNYPVGERTVACQAVTADTTLFIGDSFMDQYFIGDYMREYAKDKEVLHAGMSSTTSYHWEASYQKIIGSTAPKNIVIHIGTNNFYDAQDLVETTEESLMRLFMFMHNSYPTSNIYWFNITQRADTRYAQKVTQTNADMANWCAKYDWITCVDTCSKVTTAMLRPEDGTHPTTDSYHVFTDALVAAGCEIVSK